MIRTNQIVLIIQQPLFKEREEPPPDPDLDPPANQQQKQLQLQQQDTQQPAVQRSIPGPAASVLWMQGHSGDDLHHCEAPIAKPKRSHPQPDVQQTKPDNDPYILDMADLSSLPQGQGSI